MTLAEPHSRLFADAPMLTCQHRETHAAPGKPCDISGYGLPAVAGSEDRFSASDPQHGAGHVARIGRRGQEDVGRGHLAGLASTAQRRVRAEGLDLVAGSGCWLQRRPDRARCDGVDPDSARSEVGREVDGEVVDGGFGRGVVEQLRGGLVGLDRAGVDDARTRDPCVARRPGSATTPRTGWC